MILSENLSIYLQIAERICDEILDNVYPPGERIPSIREYAAMVEVNANTVVRSYEWLQRLEIIYNKRGLGYFVAPDGKHRIREMRREQFFRDELPKFFSRLYTLDIDVSEIEKQYVEYLKKKSGVLELNPPTDTIV